MKKTPIIAAGIAGLVATTAFLNSNSAQPEEKPIERSTQRYSREVSPEKMQYRLVDRLHQASQNGDARGIYDSIAAINTHEQKTGAQSTVGMYVENFFDANPNLANYSADEVRFVQDLAKGQATLWEERTSDKPFLYDHTADAQIGKLHSYAGNTDLALSYFTKALDGKKAKLAKVGKPPGLADLAEMGSYAAHTTPQDAHLYLTRIQSELEKGNDLNPIEAEELGNLVVTLHNNGYQDQAAQIGPMVLDQALYTVQDTTDSVPADLYRDTLGVMKLRPEMDSGLKDVLRDVTEVSKTPVEHESVQYLNR